MYVCFTVQRVFQNLMETVVKTVYRSLGLLSVLIMISIMYSFIGALFFANIRSGEALDYSMVNFNGIRASLGLVIRIMTGEDWYQILWDTMVCVCMYVRYRVAIH